MANPDFANIEANNFEKYYYEHFLTTCSSYPNSDKVENLIKQGINNRLFLPELHGREHLNAPRWMRGLKADNKGLLLQFKHNSIGANSYNGIELPMHLGAFDPEFIEDDSEINLSLHEAAEMFHRTFGYRAKHFIEPDAYATEDFEYELSKAGIKYILRSKLMKYSIHNNKQSRTKFNWIGKSNKHGQIFLTRNCTFEPHRPLELDDVVGACLKEIEAAFFMKKPAIIISHRASYIGSISEKNQINGLGKLKELLTQITVNWPDVEFMSSSELGDLIGDVSDNC
jgi:hypothetical protein